MATQARGRSRIEAATELATALEMELYGQAGHRFSVVPPHDANASELWLVTKPDPKGEGYIAEVEE